MRCWESRSLRSSTRLCSWSSWRCSKARSSASSFSEWSRASVSARTALRSVSTLTFCASAMVCTHSQAVSTRAVASVSAFLIWACSSSRVLRPSWVASVTRWVVATRPLRTSSNWFITCCISPLCTPWACWYSASVVCACLTFCCSVRVAVCCEERASCWRWICCDCTTDSTISCPSVLDSADTSRSEVSGRWSPAAIACHSGCSESCIPTGPWMRWKSSRRRKWRRKSLTMPSKSAFCRTSCGTLICAIWLMISDMVGF